MKYLALTIILLFFAAFICAPAAADVIVIFTDNDATPTPAPTITPTKEIYHYDEGLLRQAQYVVDWYEPLILSGNVDDVGKMQYESAKTIVNNQGVVGNVNDFDTDRFMVKMAYRLLTEPPEPTSSPTPIIAVIAAFAAAATIINRR